MRSIYALLLLVGSCNSGPTKHTVSEAFEERTQLSFPESSYDQVILFRIKATKYNSFDHIMVETEQGSATSPYTNGLTFIDSLGKPTKQYYDQHSLSTDEALELVSIIQSPLEVLVTSCVPIYRDVFVFYDTKKQQVAQVQICLDCGHLFLTTKKGIQSFQMNQGKEYDRLYKLINRLANFKH